MKMGGSLLLLVFYALFIEIGLEEEIEIKKEVS